MLILKLGRCTVPSLKVAYSNYTQTGIENDAPFGAVGSGSGVSRVYLGDQMVDGPCLIKRMYFWNDNDGPVNVWLHDGYGVGIAFNLLPKAIIYKVGQQSQLQIDVPEPGFIMSAGVFFRHANKSSGSNAKVTATLVYEDLPQGAISQFTVTGSETSFTETFTIATGTPACTLGNTAKLEVGMGVSGLNVPDATEIIAIVSATAFTMSEDAAASGSRTLTFTPDTQ